MWGIFFFRRFVLWSPNYRGKDTTEPTKECILNNNRTLGLVYIRDIRIYLITKKQIWCTQGDNRNTYSKRRIWELVNAHLEAAAESLSPQQRAKPRVPWETFAVRKKHASVKTASKCNKKNPTSINALKLKKAQNESTNVYLKEQREYIQNWLKIDNLG